ncbi:MAG: aminodeoxychorismate/anthranilate synthase component II [Proteobacteria bacterium]|nr:aminodeoxychorismate/anthranilate synthase component II [Pseudomonadota bacterium]
MLVMIDNYDSFTYNLVQYLRMLGTEIQVYRNDAMTLSDIAALKPEGIVISPGPGRPDSAGISLDIIRYFAGKIPVLGVCLGHQSIAQAFGGAIVSAKKLMHGKTSMIQSDGKNLFHGMAKPFQAMRYHSLAVSRDKFPDCLEITAESEDGEIMGIRHKTLCVEGIQFHPESIMTPMGKRLLRNFLKLSRGEL